MSSSRFTSNLIWSVTTVLLSLAFCLTLGGLDASAQHVNRWLAGAGSFQNDYADAGATLEISGRSGVIWPAIEPDASMERARALWIGTANWTDARGEHFERKVIHRGFREPGIGVFFPIRFEMHARFDRPIVRVDGLDVFDKPVTINVVNPDLEPDRMILTRINTDLGITIDARIMQFSQEYHDNYHITEWTFTNTGNVNDDDHIELPNQTLEDLYFMFGARDQPVQAGRFVGGGAGHGQNTAHDLMLPGMEDFPDVDFVGRFSWHGYVPSFTRWNNIGGPVLDDSPNYIPAGDSVGRLAAYQFVGDATLHADTSPMNRAHDLNQPATMGFMRGTTPLEGAKDPHNHALMREEYELLSEGRTSPFHADQLCPPDGSPWRVRMAYCTVDPAMGTTGVTRKYNSYGPYTLGPGESVHFVIVEGASGLSSHAALEIGKAFKRSHLAGNGMAPIEYEVGGVSHSMSKNEWVMTGRDSLVQSFRRAQANFRSGYNIPRAPLPPREFKIDSGTDRIVLQWETFPGAVQEGWEIWRSTDLFGVVVPYEKIAELTGNAREYHDEEVSRGREYYYYLQALGPVNQDGAGMTPTGVRLRSNRYYTQSYAPAFLKRQPGDAMASARVVPNPYNLASSGQVRWPEQQDRIGFLDIPGNATIWIFTEIGELVETIEHADGSGDAYWNLTTASNQVVASGLYIAAIRNNDTGEFIRRIFAIIR